MEPDATVRPSGNPRTGLFVVTVKGWSMHPYSVAVGALPE